MQMPLFVREVAQSDGGFYLGQKIPLKNEANNASLCKGGETKWRWFFDIAKNFPNPIYKGG